MHLTHGECANSCGNCSICKPLGFRVCFSDLYCEESKAFFSRGSFLPSQVTSESKQSADFFDTEKSARQSTDGSSKPASRLGKRKKIIHKTNKPNCLSKRYYVIKVYYLRCENGKRRSSQRSKILEVKKKLLHFNLSEKNRIPRDESTRGAQLENRE